MADKNQLKHVDPVDFGDDDPFAELTQIMGFDPRLPARPSADDAAATDDGGMLEAGDAVADDADHGTELDLALDLEKELMGDLSFDVEAGATEPGPNLESAPATVTAADDLALEDLGLDEAFDDALAGPEIHAERAEAEETQPEDAARIEASAASSPDDAADGPHAAFDIDLAAESELDDELSLGAHEAVETSVDLSVVEAADDGPDDDLVGDIDFSSIQSAADDSEVAGVSLGDAGEGEVVDQVAAQADADPLVALAEFGARHEEQPAAQHEDAEAQDVIEEYDDGDLAAAEFDEPAGVPADAAPADNGTAALDAHFDVAMADVDMDFGADPAFADEIAGDSAASMTAQTTVPYDVSHFEPGMPGEEGIDLEAELGALLGNSVPRADLPGGYDESRLNLHVDRGDDADHDAYEAVRDDEAATAAAYEQDDDAYEAAGDDTGALEFDDHHFQAAFDNTLDAHFEADDLIEVEGAHEAEDVDYAASSDEDGNPFDALQEMAAARERADAARSRVFQAFSGDAAGEAAAVVSTAGNDVPDIETIEVPEGAIVVEDDLDIPEIDYEEDVAAAGPYDEFESDFAAAYQDIGQSARPSPAAVAGYGGFAQSFSRGPAASIGRRQSDIAPGAPSASVDDDTFAQEFSADLFDAMAADQATTAAGPEAVGEDYSTVAGAEDDPFQVTEVPPFVADRQVRRGRGLMVAGIVAGVAVLGGVGAFALSVGDGAGSDVPAVVKADADPIKVRPKNPGGTTVPNQDNKVYETVASGEKPTLPEQKTLITAAEEPVDVASKSNAARVVTPSEPVDQPASDPIAEKITQKGEDRLTASTDAETPAARPDVVAVAPRQVRTMIVRSDGTLVPREEAAPEVASLNDEPKAGADAMPIDTSRSTPAQAGAIVAGADPEETTGSTTQSPEDNAKAAEVVNSPTAVSKVVPATQQTMPDKVALAPSRPGDQPLDIVGEVKPDKVASVSPASAAVAGPWTVQIASQPSEEAAKASYKNLSQRYSSVIGGKGVNIVKADIAGKGTYWRVRIPAGDRNSAISLCESYKSAGGNCFVSK